MVRDADVSLLIEGLSSDATVSFTLTYASPDNAFTTSDTIALRVVDSLAITGRLTYELSAGRYVNNSVHPLPISGTAVYAKYATQLGATTTTALVYTDDNGFYCLPFTYDVITATTIRFFVAAQAEPAGNGEPVYEVVSSGAAQTVYDYMMDLSLPSQNRFYMQNVLSPVIHESLNFVAGQRTVPGQPLVSYANIFDVFSATTTAYAYFERRLWDAPPDDVVRVVYGIPSAKPNRSEYDHVTHVIVYNPYLSGDLGEDTWDVIDHEYGHYVADCVGFLSLVGPDHWPGRLHLKLGSEQEFQ